jgi:hypothetical protein
MPTTVNPVSRVWICRPSAIIQIGLGGLACLFGPGIFLLGGYFSLFYSGIDIKGLFFSLIFGSFWCYVDLSVIRMRIEIDENEIRFRGAFSQKNVLQKDIAGFVVLSEGLGKQIRLLDSQGGLLASIPNYIEQFPQIVTWLEGRFRGPAAGAPTVP